MRLHRRRHFLRRLTTLTLASITSLLLLLRPARHHSITPGPDSSINWELVARVTQPEQDASQNRSSQFGQDQWVTSLHPGPGTYLDIGANDATRYSNTYELDRRGWTGWCVDPFPTDFEGSDRSCHVVRAAVSDHSGKAVTFVKPLNGALGGIADTLDAHRDAVMRANGTQLVDMHTLGVQQLLEEHAVPRVLDYMSVDAEGHEDVILRAFPFDQYRVDMITVEHNHEEPKRSLIRERLLASGFVLAFNIDVDDWYLSNRMVAELTPSLLLA